MQSVGKIMTKPSIAIMADATVQQALIQILAGGYSGMPVIDAESHVIGIVTQLDLIKAIRSSQPLDRTPVGNVMTKKPVTIDVATDVDKVVEIMVDKGFIRIPVTEKGKLVGVVSRSDVLRSYYQPDSITYL